MHDGWVSPAVWVLVSQFSHKALWILSAAGMIMALFVSMVVNLNFWTISWCTKIGLHRIHPLHKTSSKLLPQWFNDWIKIINQHNLEKSILFKVIIMLLSILYTVAISVIFIIIYMDLVWISLTIMHQIIEYSLWLLAFAEYCQLPIATFIQTLFCMPACFISGCPRPVTGTVWPWSPSPPRSSPHLPCLKTPPR